MQESGLGARAQTDSPASSLDSSLVAQSGGRLEYDKLLALLTLYALSPPGRSAILGLRPTRELERATAWYRQVAEAQQLLSESFDFRLEGLADVPVLLGADGKSRVLKTVELHSVLRVLLIARHVRTSLTARSDLPALALLVHVLNELPDLLLDLERSIDARGNVLDAASSELARLRRQAAQLETELRAWIERRRDAPELRGVLQDQIITVRNGRHVLAVKAEHRHRVRGVHHGESASGSTLYIEPEGIVRQGDELAELRGKELREIERIVAELVRRVQAARKVILGDFEALLEIEIAATKARFGRAFQGSIPELVAARDLVLIGARHPLLLWRERDPAGGPLDPGFAQALARVEPLSLELGRTHHQLVITGPNTGGKTVALKTVGLLSQMALTGIPIPAQPGCRIPTFDAIYADIGDEQSIEQNLSTFSSHMQEVSVILGHATARSLVLLDELGAGTDPLEGAALGEAILAALYERGATTLVTTHLGQLKEYAFSHRKCLNACMEFDPERLAPTFRLIVGLPGRSNALVIARRLGISERIITVARELLANEQRIDDKLLVGLERTQQQLRRQQSDVVRDQDAARTLKEDAAHELAEARAVKRAIEHEAERAEEARVRAVVDQLEAGLRQLGEPAKERREQYQRLLELLKSARDATRLAERRRATAERLRKGDPVYIPRLRAICEVKKINKTKELISVDLGGIPTEVHFQEISWVLPPPGYEIEWSSEAE
ncbi:MAG: endonuclease MutS2 [Planctomycetota bacterium]